MFEIAYQIWARIAGTAALVWMHLVVSPLALVHQNFARNHLLAGTCRFLLKALRIHVVEVGHPARLPQTAVYIANHTSTLDIFIYNVLRIPRCAFFMTGYHWVVAPIYIPAWALGTFFTASQADTHKRRQIFSRAAESLRRSGDNVLLTPEGQRYLDGQVGPFNKGAFHLAISLGRPIMPLFIEIEKRIDPGMGLKTEPGIVQVYWGKAFDAWPTEFDGERKWPDLFRGWYQDFNVYLKTGVPLQDPRNPFFDLQSESARALGSQNPVAASDGKLDRKLSDQLGV